MRAKLKPPCEAETDLCARLQWHLGHRPQFLPPNRGFDRFLGLPFSAGSGSTDPNKCSFDTELTHWLPLYNGTRIVESPVDLSRLAIRYAAAATDFIGETARQARPFFLYLPFSHIHHLCPPGSPLTDQQWGGPAFRHRGNAGGVAEAVEEMDWITGQVLGALDRAGVTNNTLVIWTADNGPTTSERYNGGTVGPFVGRYARAVIDASCTTCPGGYKIDSTAARPHRCSTPTHDLDGIPCAADVGLGSTWEANLRMPAFARWPGHIQAGAISLAMVSTLDVFATGLALAGLPLPTDRTIDSVNMLPVLLGIGGGDHSTSNGTHEFLFHYRDDCPGHCGPHNTSIPFVCPCGAAYPDGAPHQKLYAARRWNWKVHYITKSAFGHDPALVHDPPLLFNVAADPAEEWPVDPANAPPGTVEAIAAAVARFEAGLVWGRAMNVREDPTLWPCCTEFPRPVVGPPRNQCRCSLDQPVGNTG